MNVCVCICFILIKHTASTTDDVSSASYNRYLKGMGVQLDAITARLDELPTTIAASIANAQLFSSSSSSSSNPRRVQLLPQLDYNNFRDTKHWYNSKYLKMKKKGKGKQEDDEDDAHLDDLDTGTFAKASGSEEGSITSCYMEDAQGNPIPEPDRDAARAKARAFWLQLLRDGRAPQKHGVAPSDVKDKYILLMEESFPWLRYCENHWKTEQIWRNHYSQWYGNVQRKAKAEAEKAVAEGIVIDVIADSNDVQDVQGRPSKRPRPDDDPSSHSAPATITTKRARVR